MSISKPLKEEYKSNAVLTDFGGDKNGIPRVIFHAALGTMNCFRLLIKHFVNQNIGPVIGVTIADIKRYGELNVETLISDTAEDYANQLEKTGYKEFQLIGYCFGGLISAEVASKLIKKGLKVKDFVLVDSKPLLFDIGDDLLLEYFFVPNLNISFEKSLALSGIGDVSPQDIGRGLLKVFKENNMSVPKGSMFKIGGDENLDKVGSVFEKLNKMTKKERFEIYLKGLFQNDQNFMSPEMAEILFEMYSKNTRSARFPLTPYNGDIRFLKAVDEIDFVPGMGDMVLDFWKNICKGEFNITEVEGNHLTCVEKEPYASQLADEIAKPFHLNNI